MQLRARLGEFLDSASAGERIAIERDHRPIAVLVSPEDAARLDESLAERRARARAAMDRLSAFGERMARKYPHIKDLPDAATLIRQERDGRYGEKG